MDNWTFILKEKFIKKQVNVQDGLRLVRQKQHSKSAIYKFNAQKNTHTLHTSNTNSDKQTKDTPIECYHQNQKKLNIKSKVNSKNKNQTRTAETNTTIDTIL